jgi:hypothetical protein
MLSISAHSNTINIWSDGVGHSVSIAYNSGDPSSSVMKVRSIIELPLSFPGLVMAPSSLLRIRL